MRAGSEGPVASRPPWRPSGVAARPSSRGPRAELDVDRIVRAAVEIANTDGLEAVSMARVAEALGFTTMSLYRHVSNKDELFQLMWNASAFALGDWEPEGDTWRERLLSWATHPASDDRREHLDHPAAHVQPSPGARRRWRWLELGLGVLERRGPAPDITKIRLLGLISQHALIDARMLYDERRARELAEETGVETDYMVLVRELADPAVYPILTRVVSEGAPVALPARRVRGVPLRHRADPRRLRGGYSLTEE